MKVLGLYAYIFLAAAGVAHSIFYLPAMPNPMASHFDLQGAPDAWVSPAVFFAGTGVVFILITLVFVVVPLAGRGLADRLKSPLNKGHKQEPNRRDVLLELMVSRMVWAGNFTLVFLTFILHQVFLANMTPAPKIDGLAVWTAVAVYFLFLVLWAAGLLRRLSKGVGE